jgi:hypothetical protein
VYNRGAAEAHSQADDELGPKQSREFLAVERGRNSVALAQGRNQGVDVAGDAGILTLAESPGIHPHTQLRRGY